MKTIAIFLLSITLLLGGCYSEKDIVSNSINNFCLGAGYSGGKIGDYECKDISRNICYTYKYSCYNVMLTGSIDI